MKITPVIALLIFGLLGACEQPTMDASAKEILTDNTTFKGKWKLVGILLGDVIDRPCAGTDNNRDVTLEIASDGANTFKFSGQSAVNNYFATAKVETFDATKNKGNLIVSNLGSTEMASTDPLFNECESRYFTLLSTATDFSLAKSISGKSLLYLGQIKVHAQPSLDGGTYFIFEKVD